MVQGLKDKKYQYFGSNRVYYSGVPIGSTIAWSWVGFSGTNTGFGPHGNTENQRVALVSSGTSVMQWSYNSGLSIAGELFGGDSFTQDGVNVSGLWVRSSVASQKFRLWAW